MEILQRAISKYRQGISDDEIEQEIEKKMLELKPNEQGRTQINVEDSNQGENISNNNSNSFLLNLTTENLELEDLTIQEAQVQIDSK